MQLHLGILLPHDDLLGMHDHKLKNSISELSKLLERDDLDQDLVVKIKYELELYSKFTKENYSISYDLSNTLISVHDPVLDHGTNHEILFKGDDIDQMRKEEVESQGFERDLDRFEDDSDNLLSCWIMKSLSGQLFKELSRFGSPTVLKACSKFIVFGTSSSVILVFDQCQKLIGILDPPLKFAATCLGISNSQKLIVSGHESGHIFIWDLQKKLVIKAIPSIPSDMFQESVDGHLSNSSIIHLTFLGQKERFISADDTGSAFYHEFNQSFLMYSINSTRIHNHPRENTLATAIYNIKGLPTSYKNYDGIRMVAMTTPYKLVIMNMKPSPWIVFRYYWAADGHNDSKKVSCSCVSWMPISKGETKTPQLAVSFGSKIIIFDIFYNLNATEFDDTKLKFSIFVWKEWEIDDNIVYMEWITENLLLCITSKEKVVFSSVKQGKYLEQASVESLSLTFSDCFFGSATKLGIRSEKSLHKTVSFFNGKLFVLGKEHTAIVSIVSWKDRLNSLMDLDIYSKAFDMAQAFYDGKINYAVTDVPGNNGDRLDIIGSFIVLMITRLIDASTDLERPITHDIVNLLIGASIKIGKIDLIFGMIYHSFRKSDRSDIFFFALESRILNVDVTSIQTPIVMSELISFFVSQDAFDRLEKVLIMLDLENLDIDDTLSICRKHGLLTALIRIFNLCLDDYIAPLYEIINICFNDPQYMHKIGTVFDYLQSCFTGNSFPDGSLLGGGKGISISKDCIMGLFAQKSPEMSVLAKETQYPILKILLSINCSKFLEIFELWFNDFFSENVNKVQKPDLKNSNVILEKNLMILAFIHLGETAENSQEESKINLFIAKMIVKHSLKFKFEIIRKVAYALANSTDSESFMPRQNAVIDIFNFYETDFTNQDIDSYLEEYANVQFWKIYELIGRKRRRFDLVLLGLINDITRRDVLRESLISLINDPLLTIEEQKTLKESIYLYMENLVKIQIGIGSIINNCWPLDHDLVLDSLCSKSKLRYLDDLFSDYEIKKESINSYWIGLYDTWLILLCELEPLRVKLVLARNFPFTVPKILNACKSNRIFDGTLFLLEQDNQISAALIYLKNELDANSNSLLVSEAIRFCKRNKNQISSTEIQDFYIDIFNSCSQNSNLDLQSLLDIMIGDLSSFKIFIKLIKSAPQSNQFIQILNSLLTQLSVESESTQHILEIVDDESMIELESLLKIKRKGQLYM